MSAVITNAKPAQRFEHTLCEHLGSVVFGMDEIIHGAVIGIIAGGHVLLQGVPGVGKTLLAKSLARALGGNFRRAQCTADMMPSDITGIHIYDADERRFELLPGPLFANVVLVDEINRAGPKTQSALLQAMEEGQVTIDRQTYPLPDDFFVIATQNPHDFEGTFPLPESQLDRFLLRMEVGYPSVAMEEQVLRTYDVPGGGHSRVNPPLAALPKSALAEVRASLAGIHISENIYRYVLEIAQASREHPRVSLGLSTRGALSLMRCARIEAALRGGEYVTPDDVKGAAPLVMAHRLILTADALLEGFRGKDVVGDLLGRITIPAE